MIDVSPIHEDASAKHARESPPPAYNDAVRGTKEQGNGGSAEGEEGEKEEKKETKVVGTFEVVRICFKEICRITIFYIEKLAISSFFGIVSIHPFFFFQVRDFLL